MREAALLRKIISWPMLICVFTGIVSGLPLYLLIQLVPAWLRGEGVDLTTIGLFTLVGAPYVWKFLWAPLLDAWTPPFLGRRRGWLLMTQIGLILSIALIGLFHPLDQIGVVAFVTVLVAIFSATQDVAIDAYRRELLHGDAELGLGNAIHVQAYRVAGLIPGSLGMVLADSIPWDQVFLVMAAFMLIGVALTLAIREPSRHSAGAANLVSVARTAFSEFFTRRGLGGGLLVLTFILAYKLGDSMATALSTPFYLDLGFTNSEIGLIAKNAALWPSIIGGLLGGLLIVRIGINRGLWLFGVVQIVSILGFVWLAEVGRDPILLAGVIAFEYLGVGLGTAAFIGFIARETEPALAATQFALFTALAAVPRTFLNAASGYLAETLGWSGFFVLCTLIAIPGMLLLIRVAPFNARTEVTTQAEDSAIDAPTQR